MRINLPSVCVLIVIAILSFDADAQLKFGFTVTNRQLIEESIMAAKKDLIVDKVDTSAFYYIPIISTCLTSIAIDNKNPLNMPVLSEVLLFRKKTKAISGSYFFCKESKTFYSFNKHEPVSGTLPCRSYDRFVIIGNTQYSKIEKLIRKEKTGLLLSVEDLNAVFFISEKGIVMIPGITR